MSYSGIILAGGQSSRMGQDKALMEIDGIPMIQRIASVLKEFTDEIIIASNNTIHHQYGDSGISDNFPHAGPMAGIETGLQIARNNSSIVVSCDTPFITATILESLVAEKDHDAIIARCNGRIHPLVGIYRDSSLETIQSHLSTKRLKMQDLLHSLNTKFIDFPNSMEEAFNNINTKEEWKQAIGK